MGGKAKFEFDAICSRGGELSGYAGDRKKESRLFLTALYTWEMIGAFGRCDPSTSKRATVQDLRCCVPKARRSDEHSEGRRIEEGVTWGELGAQIFRSRRRQRR